MQFYKNDYGNYLALRALNYRLGQSESDPGFKSSQNFMWDMALAIEEGDLANAAEELRSCRTSCRMRWNAARRMKKSVH